MEERNLRDFKYYRNRELSWIQFNERVLEEATDKTNPLLERMRFLSIFSSNLDEFIVVRVGSLKNMELAGYVKPDIAGMSPTVSLSHISQKVHEVVEEAYKVYDGIKEDLARERINIVSSRDELTESQLRQTESYFNSRIKDKLVVELLEKDTEFPLIKSGKIYVCALVRKKESAENSLALIELPGHHRLYRIESANENTYIPIDEIVKNNIASLLSEYEIQAVSGFRIYRNADLTLENEDAEDLLSNIEHQLHKRDSGRIIRADFDASVDKRLVDMISNNVNATPKNSFYVNGPLDLSFLDEIYSDINRSDLKEKPFTPISYDIFREDRDIFRSIRLKDRLLICPYESFDPVARFIARSAEDKSVLAIRQTLYRVDTNSPIVKALAHASYCGKSVTVLVELKARFDEENNIGWARMLEKAGCHVIYGPAGLKTHGKITLVIRKEEGVLRNYLHLGTGNYNTSTAKRYTDISLLTCDEVLGRDAIKFFNVLGGSNEPRTADKLIIAPTMLKSRLIRLIDREIAFSKSGRYAEIIAKMNSLCDPDIIEKLYEASNAGVRINLLVRGICCLKTGIPGVSENISVKSIVGRFLEHSRICKFENGGNPEYYCSSADWMPRNLERRVEIMYPITDEDNKRKLNQYLINMIHDDVKGRTLQTNGEYAKTERGSYSYQDDYIERNEL